MLGDGAERDLVDRLVRLSEGNAFYLEELIRATAEGQRSDLPETVVGMVHSRLGALDDNARRILRAASAFGEEQHGEHDPLVLAEHFARGNQGARAGLHYLRAAEQANQAGDATAVIAQAKRALGYDMPDEVRIRCLGMLCELRYYSMDLQSDALPHAEEVLRVAQQGSTPWSQGMLVKTVCSIQAGNLEEFMALLETTGATSPAPGAATPWSVCVATGIYLLDLLGRTPATNHLLHKLTAEVRTAGDRESMASVLFHAILAVRMSYADDDPMKGLEHGEALSRIAEAVGQRRFVELAKNFIDMNRWCLDALADTEHMIVSVTLSDNDAGLGSSYRPFVLAWLLADRGAFGEAQTWARRLIEAGQTRRVPLDQGRGHWVLAEVLRRAGELDRADAEIQAALAILRTASPLDTPGVLATLAALRLAQGRSAEALAAAEEGLAKYKAMTTCGFSAVPSCTWSMPNAWRRPRTTTPPGPPLPKRASACSRLLRRSATPNTGRASWTAYPRTGKPWRSLNNGWDSLAGHPVHPIENPAGAEAHQRLDR